MAGSGEALETGFISGVLSPAEKARLAGSSTLR